LKTNRHLMLTLMLVLFLHNCSSKSVSVLSPNTLKPQTSANDDAAWIATLEKLRQTGSFDKLKDSFTICSINNHPLTMTDYRHQLKSQQQQIQATLAVNPEAKLRLLKLARERKISLTPSEKKEISERANRFRATGSKAFSKLLRDSKVTPADFDAQVLDMGLACKASKSMIEANLLPELINRELLCSQARANGLSKEALSKCAEIKHSRQYNEILKSSGLTPEEIESELLKNELCNLMIKKIQSPSGVSQSDVRKFYEENKNRFYHGNRIRLSQILVKAPSQDLGPIQSLRTQLKKSNPNVSEIDLDKQVEAIVTRQRKKADSLLTRAQSGADFAQLANQNTEDEPARLNKSGGDLGFQEEARLPKSFREQLQALTVGEVGSKLIESPIGFHILKLTGKEGPGPISFDECKDQIKALLTEQNSKESLEKWLNDQRQKAVITPSPELLALISSTKTAKRGK